VALLDVDGVKRA